MSLDPVNLETDATSSGNDTDDIETTYIKAVTMYRLYNPHSGEHFYTSSVGEKNAVVKAGWKDEGIGWYAPSEGDPVYRLYNKNGGEHHYTIRKSERDMLVKAGWKSEGVGWYSDKSKSVPLYRQYNPNAYANNHNYTTNKKESQMLISLGWKDEGIAWYGVDHKTDHNKKKPENESIKPRLIKVESSERHPADYYIDNTPDKIGYKSELDGDYDTITITLNGKLASYELENCDSTGDADLYAADINTSDGYKNLIVSVNGPDDVCQFYIFAYKGNEISLIGHTEEYEEWAKDYLEEGKALDGSGTFYLMDGDRFSADPDGILCFRSSVYIDGKTLTSYEDKTEIYHHFQNSETYEPGYRLLLSEDCEYTTDDGEMGMFTAGTLLNVTDARWNDEEDEQELQVQQNGISAWIVFDKDKVTNYRGFA